MAGEKPGKSSEEADTSTVDVNVHTSLIWSSQKECHSPVHLDTYSLNRSTIKVDIDGCKGLFLREWIVIALVFKSKPLSENHLCTEKCMNQCG